MRSQTQLALRGKDPTTLEVTLMDALSLTVGRLGVEDLVDMFALATTEDVPKNLARDLSVFVRRIENEVADLPDGGVLREIVIALQDVPATRIPNNFRALLEREGARETRLNAERVLIRSLVSSFDGFEPESFPLGVGKGPRVTRTEQTPPKTSLKADAVSTPRVKGTKEKAEKTPARSARSVSVEDPVLTKWLRNDILQRLSSYSESGLAEMVLLAGIRHAARADYPNLVNGDVTKVLKDLKETGQLRYSAGRWSLPGRW